MTADKIGNCSNRPTRSLTMALARMITNGTIWTNCDAQKGASLLCLHVPLSGDYKKTWKMVIYVNCLYVRFHLVDCGRNVEAI